jgi:histidinol-phosphate aminotransferase
MALPFAINPALADLPVYQPGRPIEEVARELGLDPAHVVKLASNENPLGPSPKAVAAVRKALANINLYPDGNAFYLKQKLAARLQVEPANLLLGNGSNEIIELVGHSLLAGPAATASRSKSGKRSGTQREVIVSEYCFLVYPLVARMFSASLRVVPAKNYGHDLRAMLKAITPQTRVLFVANPNNPTGTLVPAAELARFVRQVPERVLLVIDEAYIEFVDQPADFLALIRAGNKRNLLLMRTFSKIYGLAGLRIGYGIAHPELIAALEKPRQPFNVNSLAQAAALGALEDSAHVRKTRLNNTAGLEFFSRAFHELNLEFIPSAANFILVRVGDGQRFFEQLQKQGIIIRPMGAYQLGEWVRISMGTPRENRRCLAALKQLL